VSCFLVFYRVFVLSIAVWVLTACGIKSSSSNPSGAIQPQAPEAQKQTPIFKQTPVTTGQPSARDPLMEKGAEFMSVVMDYKRRLEKDPKDKDALLFMGNANFDISRFEQAEDYYKRYLDLDPTHPGVRTDLATSYYKTKDVDSAVRELKTVVTRVPYHEAALYNLGLILWQDRHDTAGAIEAWEALLKAHPNHPKAAEVQKLVDEMKKKS
jgi:tetratricopeptide (TPR) repeat protein